MKSSWAIFLTILTLITSCEQRKQSDSDSADNIYDYKRYNRFILVKSDTVFSSASKISDFGQLPQEGNIHNHVFDFGKISQWELIKVSEELDNAYFHNIAYWLLGFGDADPNHADKSIIILTDKETNDIRYLGLIDSGITNIDDSMLLISNNDDQFIIEIPFHTFKTVDKKFNYNIETFLKANSITADDFKDLILETIEIRFNEKTGR